MSDPTWCESCDMHNCGHVTGADARYNVNDTFEVSGPTIEARMSGRCKGCGRPFEEGTPISYSREADGWITGCCT